MLLCNFDANCSLGEIRIDQAVLPMDQKARPERLLGAYYIQPNSGYIRPETCFAQGYQQNKPQYPRRKYLPDSDSQAQVRQRIVTPKYPRAFKNLSECGTMKYNKFQRTVTKYN